MAELANTAKLLQLTALGGAKRRRTLRISSSDHLTSHHDAIDEFSLQQISCVKTVKKEPDMFSVGLFQVLDKSGYTVEFFVGIGFLKHLKSTQSSYVSLLSHAQVT